MTGSFRQQFASGERNLTSGQHAMTEIRSVNGNGAQGMLQSSPPSGFNDMVDAAILRQRLGIFAPVPLLSAGLMPPGWRPVFVPAASFHHSPR